MGLLQIIILLYNLLQGQEMIHCFDNLPQQTTAKQLSITFRIKVWNSHTPAGSQTDQCRLMK